MTGQQAVGRMEAGVAAALLAAFVVQVGAGFALLGLQALLEAPTLAALALGLRDLHAAGVIYTCRCS